MNISDVHTAVVHCSATPAAMDIGRDEINEWHLANGWSGIGYHHVIRRDGTVEGGRALSEQGAHVKGHNRNTWGICMVGGVKQDGKTPEDNFTPEQYRSLKSMLTTYRSLAPGLSIVGHRDCSPDLNGDGQITKDEWVKDCPCFDVRAKLEEWGTT